MSAAITALGALDTASRLTAGGLDGDLLAVRIALMFREQARARPMSKPLPEMSLCDLYEWATGLAAPAYLQTVGSRL